jgi:hypothetical protein
MPTLIVEKLNSIPPRFQFRGLYREIIQKTKELSFDELLKRKID